MSFLTPFVLRVGGILLAVLAFAGLLWSAAEDLKHRGAEGEHAARVQEQQAASAAAGAQTAHDAQVRKDVSDEAQRMEARLVADRAAGVTVDQRVLDAAREAGRRQALAAATGGASAPAPDVVSALMFSRVQQAARVLADVADERGLHGTSCQRVGQSDTESVTP